jgi:hypothetical protein
MKIWRVHIYTHLLCLFVLFYQSCIFLASIQFQVLLIIVSRWTFLSVSSLEFLVLLVSRSTFSFVVSH